MKLRQLLTLLAALTAPNALAQSADPDVRFVEAMRAAGRHELVIEYLEAAAKGGVATPALKQRVPYELAVTRLDQARSIVDADGRERAVAQAQRDLERFIQQTEDQTLVAEGSGRLALALSDQGYRLLARADTQARGGGKDEAKKLRQDARKAYDTARELHLKAAAAYDKALEAYKAVKPGSDEAQQRVALRGEMARMEVLAARTLKDKAASHGEKSKEFKQLNTTAAEDLLKLYDKYTPEPVALWAHLWEGQCYQATGENRLATGCFEELVFQDPGVPAYRPIITLAHAYLIQCRLLEKQYEKALEDGSGWFSDLRGDERTDAPAATLAYELGEAARLAAADADGTDATRLLNRAQDYYQAASRSPGEFQSEARLKLAAVNDKLGAEATAPTTFAEAYQIGRDAIAAMQAATLAAKVAANNNPGSVGELQSRVEQSRRQSLSAFAAALGLVDDETQASRVNEVRYWLAYLYWEAEDYLKAAVVSEFVARRRPDDPMAERSARLAMASLKQLYNDALTGGADGADFESERLRRLTSFVAKQWSGESVGEEALSVLMSLALRSGDLAVARDVLEQAPEDRRAGLSLKLASALWEQASRAAATAGDDEAARRAAMQQKADALAMLRESFPTARKSGPVTSELTTAGLYLAQALLEQGEAAEAVKLLEDKQVGAVPLVDKKAASVDRPGFAAETYKTALRAYVAVSPPRTDDAVKMMDQLEQAVGGDNDTLTRVYFGLGLELQRQIEDLTAAGKQPAAKRLTQAFAVFLERLSTRLGDADWVAQQWIGQTFMSLGEGLEGAGDQPTRRGYYERAAATFQSMIDRAAAEPSFAPGETSVLAARVQLGRAQSLTGEYQQAIDTFSSVLITRPTLLDVQKAAAYAYQRWGEEQDPDQLLTAIRGGRIDPETSKNLIWGWSKLASFAARAARSDVKYKDLFFECWLNVATCRYLAGEKANGATRDKNLESARRTIRSVHRQYPDLGGPQRSSQFDKLLKQIQQLEGEDPVGLKELES